MSHRPFHPSELGDDAEPLESADLLLMARELERLDGGAIRPSDGFTDRVLAAIADEPLPAPMAVAGIAAREGRFGAMLGALRDTWNVAWSGGRPLAARAQAMAFVVLLIAAVGSVGAVTTVGAFNALFPNTTAPSVSPAPSVPVVASPSPAPSASPSPSPSPSPSASPSPTETAEPTETPEPTETDRHTERPGHTEKPEATETPESGDDSGSGGGGGGSGGGHGGGETEHP